MQKVPSASAPSRRSVPRQRREREQSPKNERKASGDKGPVAKGKGTQQGKKPQTAAALQLLSLPGASVVPHASGGFAAGSPMQAAVETFGAMGQHVAGTLGAIGSHLSKPLDGKGGPVSAASGGGGSSSTQVPQNTQTSLNDRGLTREELEMGKAGLNAEKRHWTHGRILATKRLMHKRGMSLGNRLSFTFKNPTQAGIALMAGDKKSLDPQIIWERKRLRLLGAAASSLLLRRMLFERHPKANTEQLTEMGKLLINRDSFARAAVKLDVPSLFILNGGESSPRFDPGVQSSSLLVAFGVVYSQGGLTGLRGIFDNVFDAAISKAGDEMVPSKDNHQKVFEVSPDLRHKNALQLKELLGLKDIDENLLAVALNYRRKHTTNSADDSRLADRIEYLGDAALGLALSKELLERHRNQSIGKAYQYLQSANTQAEVARAFAIDKWVLDPFGDVPLDNKALSDVLETIFGTVYLSNGMSAVQPLVRKLFAKPLQNALQAGAQLERSQRWNQPRSDALSDGDFDDSM